MSKEHIQELSRLIGELNAHAYATNEHYHNCYEKICALVDVMKKQPSEVDQLIENIDEEITSLERGSTDWHAYRMAKDIINNHRP